MATTSIEWRSGTEDGLGAEVMRPVLAFFTGLRQRDRTAMLAPVLSGIEVMNLRDGKIRRQTVEKLVDMIMDYPAERIEEPITRAVIHVDGDLASVWMTYEFLVDGKPHHRGTNVFTLHRLDREWIITTKADNSMPAD